MLDALRSGPVDRTAPGLDRLPRRLTLVVAIALTVILALAAYSLWQSRINLQRQAASQAENLARLLDRSVHTVIHETDLALQVSADEFLHHDRIETAYFSARLEQLRLRLPHILSLRATDADGLIRYGAGIDPAKPVNIADRERFLVARNTPELVITSPIIARMSQQWVLPITRRLETRTGVFSGVVYANIQVDHFSQLFGTLQAGRHGAVVLFDAGTRILLRHPEPKGPGSALGLKIGSPQFKAMWKQGLRAGTYQARSTTDGIWRTYSYHQVGNYPLYIMVGLGEDDYLAPWWTQAGITAVFLAVLGVLVAMLARSLRHSLRNRNLAYLQLSESQTRLQQSEQRYRSVVDNLKEVIFQTDAEGRWTFLNPSWHELTGLSPAESLGQPFLDFVHSGDRQHNLALFESLIQRKQDDCRHQVRYLHKTEGVRWVEVYARLTLDQTGRIVGTSGTLSDISESRQYQQRLERLLAEQKAVLENDLVGIVRVRDRCVLWANPAFETMLGYGRGELVGSNSAQNYPSREAYEALGSAAYPVLAAGRIYRDQVEHVRKDGQHIWIDLSGAILDRDSGESLWTFIDITERKQAEARLQLAASVFTHAREGIMITDADGTIIDVNDAFTRITGYTHDEVQGRNPRFLKSGHHDPAFYQMMWQSLQEQGYWYGEVWNRSKSGDVFAAMQAVSAVQDGAGNTLQYVSLFSDITPIKEHERQLEYIAHYDALTHLPNRVLLADRLHQGMAQAQRQGKPLAVAYLDLDGFKAINDRHGHETGDQLLVAVANRMRQALREEDTFGRLGGDEFVAVLLDLNTIESTSVSLDRLLAAAAQPVHIGDLMLQVSASIGVTFYPQADDIDAEQLLRQADQAMYQAKLAGKNRYHIFDADQDRNVRGHHESLEHIQRALAQREFVLYYQPKVNLRSGLIVGAEALIRWQHPERGLLPPAAFLPVIEDHALAVDLGEWVIDSALAQMEIWHAAGFALPVSVNVSARQLQQPNFVTRLGGLLAAHPGICPGSLELEVLETSALQDIAQVSRIMLACRDIGVSFALDDFGTGYSSLTYLKRLPAAQLKIDQSFVHDMLEDPEDLAILEGVLGLAAAFRRQVIAEGVETVEHGTLLLQLGCDIAQGYGIARPMPAGALLNWSLAWRTDPAWADQPAISRDDLPLLHAGVEHRAWIKSIDSYLQGDLRHPPELDPEQCRFGAWLRTDARTRHGGQKVFQDLDLQHQRIHDLAEQLIQLHAQGQTGLALERLGELHTLRDTLLGQLQRLVGRQPPGE